MEKNETFTYTGTENLEIVEEAVHYNAALRGLFRNHCRPTADQKILDFGAGIGTFAGWFRDEGLAVECFEIDERQCEVLRKKGFQVSSSLNSVPDETYDCVYSFNVFEHVKDDGETLRELAQKVRKGGRIFIFVPAFMLLYSDMDRVVGHERRYSRKRLEKIARKAELEIERLRFFDSVGFFAALLFKVLGGENSDMTKGKIKLYDRVAFPVSKLSDLVCQYLFGKNLYIVCTKK